MEGLCRSFDELCVQNSTFKMLLTLARSFDPYIPSAVETRASFRASLPESTAERPAWLSYFEQDDNTKSFYDIFSELKLPEEERRACWVSLHAWLRSVLYQTSIFLPNITEETAHNMGLGHPIAIWLYEYVDLLDASCSVGMACWKSFNPKDDIVPPPALIRLPQLVIRFRTILLPVINGFHKESWEKLQELRSAYTFKK